MTTKNFDKLIDFDVRTQVAWQSGEHQGLGLGVNFQTPITLSYWKVPGTSPKIVANFNNWNGGYYEMDAPESGIHELSIRRKGSMLSAYFNDTIIYQVELTWYYQFHSVFYNFTGPKGKDNPQFAPLHVDWISVVPEPTALSIIAIGGAWLVMRRRVTSSI